MHPDEKRIGASNRRHLAWRQRNTVPWRRHRGGGAAAVGAVHGGGVGTEGATSSADAVGYRRGRRLSPPVVRPKGLVRGAADGGRVGAAAVEGGHTRSDAS